MLRETRARVSILTLVMTMLFGFVTGTRAQSPIEDAMAVALQEANLRNAHQRRGQPLHGRPQRTPCNPKRRALIGGAIGAAIGMVAVRQAAKDNGGTVGAKGTLHAGGYGSVLGAVIGAASCMRR